MVIWKRGPSSRRLTLLIWSAVILVIFFYYRWALYNVPSPLSPGSRPGAATSHRHRAGWSSRIRPESESESVGQAKDGSTKYFVKSGFDWSKLRYRYPIPEEERSHPPEGPPKPLQRVQFNFPRTALRLDPKQSAQRDAVRKAFKKCWDAYIEYGFPHDELTPVSLEGKDTFGGWAATLVDGLDTLVIMGLGEEFQAALPAIGALDWADTPLTSVNVFETTIRYLGGLLSAYDLSGEEVILLKAVELGEMIYAAFDTPNHMPPFVSPVQIPCAFTNGCRLPQERPRVTLTVATLAPKVA
jgi:hypothetical protein